jgi:hypothetical protein
VTSTRTCALLAFVAMLAIPSPRAHAWDGPKLWYEPADAMSPGGGGIFGTGGARDHRITCQDCHVDPPDGDIELRFSFSPPLASVGGVETYEPGQSYQVTVELVGERLTGPCGQYAKNNNGFAATFEDVSGRSAGVLRSDSGQTQTDCPSAYPDPGTGTTVLYRDCDVAMPEDYERASWQLGWTAPGGESGDITLHFGGVDGNCDMMSMGDLVVVGQRVLAAAPSASAGTHRRTWPAALGVLMSLSLLASLWFVARP